MCQIRLLMVVLFLGNSVCQNYDDIEDIERIEAFVAEVMELDSIPGLMLSVVKDGEPYISRGFGVSNKETDEEVDDKTLFYIASTTKAITGTLVSKLVGEHPTFNLDTAAKDVMGNEFQLSEAYRTRHMNIKDLLAHRSAYRCHDFGWMLNEIQTQDELIFKSRFFKADAPFRSTFTYSNTFYTIAGHIAGILNNNTYEDAMREHIFQPLYMEDSTFMHQATEEERRDMATPYATDIFTGDILPVSLAIFDGAEAANPSGGMLSSARDIMKWLLFQTSHGLNELGQVVVEKGDFDNTHYPWNLDFSYNTGNLKPHSPVSYVEDKYGLGWTLGYYKGYRMSTHGGSFMAMFSKAVVYPDLGNALFISVNGPSAERAFPAMQRISVFISDLLLGDEPLVNSTTPVTATNEDSGQFFDTRESIYKNNHYIDEIEEYKKQGHQHGMSEELEKYVGTYGHFGQGNMTVRIEDDELWGTWGTLGNVRLIPRLTVPDEFLCDFQEPFWFIPPVPITFQSSDGSNIDQLYISVMDPNDPPIFERDLKMADAPDPPIDECTP